MLTIDIHDVGHGACSVITLPNGKRIMVDCGCDADRPWYPSIAYLGQEIDLLLLQNLDRDHVEDIEGVLSRTRVKRYFSNPTIDADALNWLKREHVMDDSLRQVHRLLQRYDPWRGLPYLDCGNTYVCAWYNTYPIGAQSTNDLSVVLVLRYGRFTAVFGGDVESTGWKNFATSAEFNLDILLTNVYVAAHHGRENGFSPEILGAANPDVVIFSDKEKIHETQDTADNYRRYTKGIRDLTRPVDKPLAPPSRKILTTRRDGDLRIVVQPTGHYTIYKIPVARRDPLRDRLFQELLPGPLLNST